MEGESGGHKGDPPEGFLSMEDRGNHLKWSDDMDSSEGNRCSTPSSASEECIKINKRKRFLSLNKNCMDIENLGNMSKKNFHRNGQSFR